MNTTPRDPHLPPPAVVDWLLEQNWSEMIPIVNIQYEGARPHGMTKSKLWEYQMACPVLSEDDAGHILLPFEALDVFRKDQSARLAALEQKRQAPEREEAVRKASQQYAFRPLDQPSPAIGDAFEHLDQSGL